MIEYVIYDENDIREFLEVNHLVDNSESQIMEKLLSVQNKISILLNIDAEELKVIIYELKFTKYAKSDVVIKEGSFSKEIFFIFSGECSVYVEQHRIGVIKSGESFGETAAIFGKKRNATVLCSSENTTLLSFCIEHENMEFCASALATIYKNLALQINAKLEDANMNLLKII